MKKLLATGLLLASIASLLAMEEQESPRLSIQRATMALQLAIKHNNREGIFTAIEAGANPNTKFPVTLKIEGNTCGFKIIQGWTPLHYASFNGDVALTRRLLERAANANLKDSEGKKPLDYCQRPNKKLAHFIARESNGRAKHKSVHVYELLKK